MDDDIARLRDGRIDAHAGEVLPRLTAARRKRAQYALWSIGAAAAAV
jgi:hypothetical protein